MANPNVIIRKDMQKFKLLTDSTERWSAKLNKFWIETKELCSLCTSALDLEQLKAKSTNLNDISSKAKGCSLGISMRECHNEVLKECHKMKLINKGEPICLEMVKGRLERGLYITALKTLKTIDEQIEDFEKFKKVIMELLKNKSLINSDNKATTVASKADYVNNTKNVPNSTKDTNNEIDWESFDQDIHAMSLIMTGAGIEEVGEVDGSNHIEQIANLREQLKQSEKDKNAVIQKVILLEQELQNIKRQHKSLVRSTSTNFTNEDFFELSRALKQEQVARLESESKLKSLQEEARAAAFALRVTKAVANNIAYQSTFSERVRPFPSDSFMDTENYRNEIENGLHKAVTMPSPMRYISNIFEDNLAGHDKNPFHTETPNTISDDVTDVNPFIPPHQDVAESDEEEYYKHRKSFFVEKDGKILMDNSKSDIALIQEHNNDNNPFIINKNNTIHEDNDNKPVIVSENNTIHEDNANNPFIINKNNTIHEDNDNKPVIVSENNTIHEDNDNNPFITNENNTIQEDNDNNPFIINENNTIQEDNDNNPFIINENNTIQEDNDNNPFITNENNTIHEDNDNNPFITNENNTIQEDNDNNPFIINGNNIIQKDNDNNPFIINENNTIQKDNEIRQFNIKENNTTQEKEKEEEVLKMNSEEKLETVVINDDLVDEHDSVISPFEKEVNMHNNPLLEKERKLKDRKYTQSTDLALIKQISMTSNYSNTLAESFLYEKNLVTGDIKDELKKEWNPFVSNS